MLEIILSHPDLDFRFFHQDGFLKIEIRDNKQVGLVRSVSQVIDKHHVDFHAHIPKVTMVNILRSMIKQVKSGI